MSHTDLPGGSAGTESTYKARDLVSIPGSGPLEEGMATHSSIYAWRISWTEKPGGLWSKRLQSVGQD